MPKKTFKRLLWVDCVRGFAIVLMVVFHFCYDLHYFGYVDWSIPNGHGWWQFRYLILTLFIATVGISLSLAHGKQFNKKKFYRRLWQLIAASIAITIMSLWMFPNTWIYFGILHFITVASIIGITLVRFPKMALILGSIILIGYWLGLFKFYWPFHFFEQWLPAQTEDFVPLIPWLGVMLLGVGAARVLPVKQLDLPAHPWIKHFSFIGKHGLLIYLLHQPVLFAGFLLTQFLT